MPNVSELMATLPIFRGLKREHREALARVARELTVAPGEFLFREGDRGDALFVVLRGSLEILKQDRAGQLQHLATLSEGSVLGEMSLLAGAGTRSASARAQMELSLLQLPVSSVVTLLESDDVAALKLVHNLAHVLGRRLLHMDEKLVELLGKERKKEELVHFQKILTEWSF